MSPLIIAIRLPSLLLPWSIRKSNGVADTALDHADLVGVDHNLSKLGRDIQATLLRDYSLAKQFELDHEKVERCPPL